MRLRLIAAALALVMLAMAWPVHAQPTAKIYLKAAPLQDEKLLVVDLVVEDVVDLYGAEVQLHYDPGELRVQDANPRLDGVQIAPGTLLASNERFVVNNNVDTQAGLINFAATLLNPAPPVTGSGVLATIAFDITGSGPILIEFTKVQLVSSNLESLPVETENLAIGGGAPPPTIPLGNRLPAWSLWIIGALSILLLALVVGLSVREHRHRARLAATPVQRTVPPSTPGASRMSLTLTEQGNRAVKRGELEMAHELYSRAVEQDPSNAEAWLGKGLVAEQLTEKRICFQRVLALDPENKVARTELQQLAGLT